MDARVPMTCARRSLVVHRSHGREMPGLSLAVAAALGCGTSGSPTPAESGKLGRGSLDKKVIKDVISEHHREVRGCYEVQLVKQPDLAGRVLSQFTISTTGNVTDVVLRDRRWGTPRSRSVCANTS